MFVFIFCATGGFHSSVFECPRIVGYNTVPDGTGTEQEIPSAGT
jgi:hypothetical protein